MFDAAGETSGEDWGTPLAFGNAEPAAARVIPGAAEAGIQSQQRGENAWEVLKRRMQGHR